MKRLSGFISPETKPTRMADHRYGSNRSPDPPIWDFPGLHDMGWFCSCFFGGKKDAKKLKTNVLLRVRREVGSNVCSLTQSIRKHDDTVKPVFTLFAERQNIQRDHIKSTQRSSHSSRNTPSVRCIIFVTLTMFTRRYMTALTCCTYSTWIDRQRKLL